MPENITSTETQKAPEAKQPAVKRNEQIVTKSVKYFFTDKEKLEMATQLAGSHAEARNLEDDLAKIKSQFKARTEEVSGRVALLSQKIASGMEYRDSACRVVFDAQKGRKYFFPVDAPNWSPAALEEAMTPSDFHQDLIIADSEFENVSEIPLFEAGNDKGSVIVGQQGERWFCAIRMQIGAHKTTGKMDSESPSFKRRADAVARAVKHAKAWITTTHGDKVAEGFKSAFEAVVKANAELEEGGDK